MNRRRKWVASIWARFVYSRKEWVVSIWAIVARRRKWIALILAILACFVTLHVYRGRVQQEIENLNQQYKTSLDSDDLEQQLSIAEEIRELDPNDPYIVLELAKLKTKKGDLEGAIRTTKEFIEQNDSRNAELNLWLGKSLFDLKKENLERADYEEISRYLTNGLRSESPDAKAIEFLLRMQLHFGDFENAESTLSQVSQQDGVYYEDLFEFSMGQFKPEAARKALADFDAYLDRRLEMENENPQLVLAKVRVLMFEENFEAADQWLIELSDSEFKQNKIDFYLLWAAFVNRKQPSNYRMQRIIIRRGLKLDENNVRLSNQLALAYFLCPIRIKTVPEEVKSFLETGSAPPQTYLMFGTQLLSDKKYDQAIQVFELAYRKGGRSPHLANNLAHALMVRGGDKDISDARTIIDSAIESFTRVDPKLFLTRGEIACIQKDWPQAIEDLERARPFFKRNEEIVELLARAYEESGMPGLAEEFRKSTSTSALR